MWRVVLTGMLLAAGCQNVVGPFDARRPRRIDDPNLTIAEQERWGRARLALPPGQYDWAPKGNTEISTSAPR